MSRLAIRARQLSEAICAKYWHGASIGMYIGGWLGHDNLGDEAIFASMKDLVSPYSLIHFDGSRFSRLIARGVAAPSLGILGGGTLIGGSRRWLDILRTYETLSREFVVFGTGVEDPQFWRKPGALSDWIPKLSESRFVGVRGPQSASILSANGLRDVHVVGDPVLAFACDQAYSNVREQSLGINIGVSPGRVWGSQDCIMNEAVKLAGCARSNGWEVRWFVVWPNDYEITMRAAKLSRTERYVHKVFKDWSKFIAIVRSLSVFVGMKLHATVLAICANTPSIMLEYRPKCRDFMESIGNGSNNFRADQFTGGAVWDIVRQWDSNRERVASDLLLAVNRLKIYQSECASEVFRSHGEGQPA